LIWETRLDSQDIRHRRIRMEEVLNTYRETSCPGTASK
jgi:hypothetical protein